MLQYEKIKNVEYTIKLLFWKVDTAMVDLVLHILLQEHLKCFMNNIKFCQFRHWYGSPVNWFLFVDLLVHQNIDPYVSDTQTCILAQLYIGYRHKL